VTNERSPERKFVKMLTLREAEFAFRVNGKLEHAFITRADIIEEVAKSRGSEVGGQGVSMRLSMTL
jgi:hypothetical protein